MTLCVSATTNADATPREVLEFVLDLDLYRQADHKILRVVEVVGPDENGRGSAKLWGGLKYLPPAPDRQDFLLEPWHTLTFTGAAMQPARLVFDFVGRFECESTPTGTRLTHSYEFNFTWPFRFLERVLAEWLQTEIEAEVSRISALLTKTD